VLGAGFDPLSLESAGSLRSFFLTLLHVPDQIKQIPSWALFCFSSPLSSSSLRTMSQRAAKGINVFNWHRKIKLPQPIC
jgi:hypothetical protein